jgi:hypothetical protein
MFVILIELSSSDVIEKDDDFGLGLDPEQHALLVLWSQKLMRKDKERKEVIRTSVGHRTEKSKEWLRELEVHSLLLEQSTTHNFFSTKRNILRTGKISNIISKVEQSSYQRQFLAQNVRS